MSSVPFHGIYLRKFVTKKIANNFQWGTLLVAQLVEALRYKTEGRGFDSPCHWNFLLTQTFRQHYGPGVDSAYSRNEYQEYFLGGKGGRCVQLTTFWKPQVLSRSVTALLYLFKNNLQCLHSKVIRACLSKRADHKINRTYGT